MKLNDFQNSPLHAGEPPVDDAADALASGSFSDALPTSAPDILIHITQPELYAHWRAHGCTAAAFSAWQRMWIVLCLSSRQPELN